MTGHCMQFQLWSYQKTSPCLEISTLIYVQLQCWPLKKSKLLNSFTWKWTNNVAIEIRNSHFHLFYQRNRNRHIFVVFRFSILGLLHAVCVAQLRGESRRENWKLHIQMNTLKAFSCFRIFGVQKRFWWEEWVDVNNLTWYELLCPFSYLWNVWACEKGGWNSKFQLFTVDFKLKYFMKRKIHENWSGKWEKSFKSKWNYWFSIMNIFSFII